MGIFSFLKTSEKAVDAVADIIPKAASGIDKMFFTAEEKSEASLKAVELWIETQKVLVNENTAKSITRRILAVIIMGGAMLMGVGACIIFPFNVAWYAAVLAVVEKLSFMIGSVTVFYFGYYAIKNIIGDKK